MYTSDDLIADVRDQGHWADDDPYVTDSRILAEANRIQSSVYAPAIRRARADFYIFQHKIALETGRHYYRLPSQSVVSSVRKVLLVSASGTEKNLIEMPLEDVLREPPNGSPSHWTIRDGHLELNAKPTTSGYLHVEFEYMPGILTQNYHPVRILTYAATPGVTALIDSEATALSTTTTTRPTWLTDDLFYSACRANPPFSTVQLRFQVTGVETDWPLVACNLTEGGRFDGLASAVNTTGFDITKTEGETVYLSPEGTAACPQLPAELHPVLGMHTAGRLIRTIDPQLSRELLSDADTRLNEIVRAMSPRKIGKQQKLKGDSFLRRRAQMRLR